MPGYVYRNENTDQIVDNGSRPNKRFERLLNWHRITDDEATAAEAAADPEPAPFAPDPAGPAPSVPDRPSPRDSKAAWMEYARSVAKDSDEADRIARLTKQELVDAYGAEG